MAKLLLSIFCLFLYQLTDVVSRNDDRALTKLLLGKDYEGPDLSFDSLGIVRSSRASADELFDTIADDHWDYFKDTFNKEYEEEEESGRKETWMDNVLSIIQHNILHTQGQRTHRVELNKFADYTIDEFRDLILRYQAPLKREVGTLVDIENLERLEKRSLKTNKKRKRSSESTAAAKNTNDEGKDWRKTSNCVTEVKDQGICGSCWAFAATGALESLDCIWNDKRGDEAVSLSEQNFIDCSDNRNNHGCDGGYTEIGFVYAADQPVDKEECYEYTEEGTSTCVYNQTENCLHSYDYGYYSLPAEDEDILTKCVKDVGPVAVAINAGTFEWIFYESGVYSDVTNSCYSDGSHLDHAVLIVGYSDSTVDEKDNYWIVKNSWGSDWGDEGYINMARNQSNLCGIASAPTFPAVEGLHL